MKAKEVAKLLANRINQEHYILELMTKLYLKGVKDGENKNKKCKHEFIVIDKDRLQCVNCEMISPNNL